jgi:hypothetical protein
VTARPFSILKIQLADLGGYLLLPSGALGLPPVIGLASFNFEILPDDLGFALFCEGLYCGLLSLEAKTACALFWCSNAPIGDDFHVNACLRCRNRKCRPGVTAPWEEIRDPPGPRSARKHLRRNGRVAIKVTKAVHGDATIALPR